MKTTFLSALIGTVALLISIQTPAADPPDCHHALAPGSVCLMKTKELRPTQFAVGDVAVECKRKKIEKKYKKGDLEKYLAEEPRRIPAAVGPDGNFYITDHHHLATAVYRAKEGDWRGDQQKLHVTILENFRDTGISMEQFWKIMTMQRNVWPYDEKGVPVKALGEKLPKMDLGDLKDNPYRTLSRWTRESCGYIKLGKEQCVALKATGEMEPTAPYFMEFYWARYLRDQLGKKNHDLDSPKKLMASYPEAIKATLNEEKSTRFFKSQGLGAIEYGQNQKGKYLYLDFSKSGCEEWYLK